jgi:hypothetical protein
MMEVPSNLVEGNLKQMGETVSKMGATTKVTEMMGRVRPAGLHSK